jgi:hypothetical protein
MPFVPHRLPRGDLDWAELVPLIARARTPQFVSRSGVAKATVLRILGTLADGGILRVIRPGVKRRPAIYGFSELIGTVDAPPTEAPPREEPTVRTLDLVDHP